MKAFIVDDEIINISILKEMLKNHCPNIQVIGEATNYNDALLQLYKKNVDVLFLDMKLDESKTGFDLLDELRNFSADVIIVSGYDDFAVKAYKYNAIHYLLKPIDPIELIKAIRRISEQKHESVIAPAHFLHHEASSNTSSNDFEDNVVALPFRNGLEMVPVNDIVFVEGDGSYAKINLVDSKIVTVARNLKYVSEKLNGHSQFIKVHKSYLVNKKFITAYIKSDGGKLQLRTKHLIPVSITYKQDVMTLFK